MIHTVLMSVGIRPHAEFIPKVRKDAHTKTPVITSEAVLLI